MRLSILAAAVATMAAGAVALVDTIEMKDRHFFYETSGEPFFIKGVDYQPGGSADFKKGVDPLSDPQSCARDIYLFQKLGINTIRVYSVDPALDHDECMTLLASAGIYLVLDVNSPLANQHLNNEEPWTTYTPKYLQHIFSVIDVFSGYPNTLAYLAGNEVIFDEKSAKASPNYVKAVVRDMKAYITNHVARIIPVGYSNADDLKFRNSLAHYLECGDEGYIDFFGVNSYQWCGDNTFEGSGYDQLVSDYKNYSLPVFFTEYGCNKVAREWQEVAALYSDAMTEVFSGGLVYEYTQESNNYGLVDLKKDTVTTRDDYEKLLKAYQKVEGTKIPDGASKPSRPRTCPAEDSPIFDGITANHTLPFTLGQTYIDNGVKVTRGKLTTVSTRKTTEFTIKMGPKGAKKEVADPTIKATVKTDNDPLPSGGHGKNTGGGVGSGEPSGTLSADSSSSSGDESAAGLTAPQGSLFVGSLALVALGFGVFL
ncbi:Glucanosyltransferase-domain-containing protein [Geopyxis carbonaria]|nr:Glucanosyltransferase-domain-containing protein [Geopyxis carbonaria]